MWTADVSRDNIPERLPNPARQRQFRQIVVPLTSFLAVVVVLIIVLEWWSHGANAAVRVGITLTVVESVALAFMSTLTLERAPAEIWREPDGFGFRAHRLAGGFFRASHVRMKLSEVTRVSPFGKLSVVVVGRASIVRDDLPFRSFYEQIIVDRRVSDELGFDTGGTGKRYSRMEDWPTTEVRVIGTRQQRIGQALALVGGASTIGTMLAILASRDSPGTQDTLFWLLGGSVSLMALGAALWFLGMARAARGRKG